MADPVSPLKQSFRPPSKVLQVDVLVDRRSVQNAKMALEEEDILDRTRKVVPRSGGRRSIPIRITGNEKNGDSERDSILEENVRKVLDRFGIDHKITFKSIEIPAGDPKLHVDPKRHIYLERLVTAWIEHIPDSIFEGTDVSRRDLFASPPRIHARYPPLLLLAKSSFSGECWAKFRRHTSLESPSLYDGLWISIADAYQVTHIARLGNIPFLEGQGTGSSSNILRKPTQLLPLFGDFGIYTPEPSSSLDLPDTLWVSTKQNKVHQCWAPMYTMFSLGNFAEKDRLLQQLSDWHNEIDPAESTAVDLYAGIGYFSFYYAKAGFKKVLCWEINPWSVEGLRRGAAMNWWSVHSVSPDALSGVEEHMVDVGSAEIMAVFEEDNKHAARRIMALRMSIPPVRHVNCGILPTSEPSWNDAIEILDPVLGGWIHLHENIVENKRRTRVDEILRSLRDIAVLRGMYIRDHDLHKVKSYGPGITHYVLDVEMRSVML